ncbi:MAG: hypothetical protein DRN04_12170 [Thermoprotei archaeon]|nr:MAG: hypothetical protein DRN04_12170 [Thermoprotei archaeon]
MKIKQLLFSLPLLLLIFLALMILLSHVTVLTLENIYTGKKYFLNIVSDGTRLSYNFLHSYDKDRVVEEFVVEDSMLKPVKVVYSSDTYDYRELRYKCTVKMENGKIILYVKDNVKFKSIIYQVAYLAPQKLTVNINGKIYRYYLQWFGKCGEAVKLEIEEIPYILFLMLKRC